MGFFRKEKGRSFYFYLFTNKKNKRVVIDQWSFESIPNSPHQYDPAYPPLAAEFSGRGMKEMSLSRKEV